MDTKVLLPVPGEAVAESLPAKPIRRRRFSQTFKQQVIREVLAGQESVSIIARRYDLNANLVFKWKRNYTRKQDDDEVTTGLLPIHVVNSSDQDGEPSGRIDIALRAGRTVSVCGEVSTPVLKAVLEALR